MNLLFLALLILTACSNPTPPLPTPQESKVKAQPTPEAIKSHAKLQEPTPEKIIETVKFIQESKGLIENEFQQSDKTKPRGPTVRAEEDKFDKMEFSAKEFYEED